MGTQLRPYLDTFDLEKFHFVDGGNIVRDPDTEFFELERFFGVEHNLKFSFNKEKGYPCLSRPVPMCLGADKGHTRDGHHASPDEQIPEQMKMIRTFYAPEMEKIFSLVYPTVSKASFCDSADYPRFSWLKLYICE